MEVRGLGWLGTRTERWAELVAFYKDVLGLRAVVDGTEFAVFELPDGSQVEVFGPSMEKCAHFATGPVTGFLVDDLPKARAEMEASGVEFLGETESVGETSWAHFRGPDGNVYEITQRGS